MAAIDIDRTDAVVILVSHTIKGWRQICVGKISAGTRDRADIARSQIPTRPVGLAQIVAIINGLDRALNQIMAMVIGVDGSPGGVSELHLQGCVDDGGSLKDG